MPPIPASRRLNGSRPHGPGGGPWLAAIVTGLATTLTLPGFWSPLEAGVLFQDCVSGSDGSISCDTVPTGNTLMDDEAARYGLLNNASAGWSEFDPYAGYDGEFGGGED